MSLLEQFRLYDQVAVVTGAGQGIGRAIAVGLADAGCDLVLNARRRSDLERTASGVEQRGRRTLIADADIRDFSDKLAELIVTEFGRLDVWVNDVGGSGEKTTRELTDTPDDIAGAVWYLASPAAAWVTGQNILVAGGRTERSYQYEPKP